MKRLGGVGLALLAVLAIALRGYRLGRESLWFDEGMTWWLASLPPAELIRVIRGDVAAPLHYLLLHGWRGLFGDSDVAMRSMSAVASTLTLVPFYFLARHVLQSQIALWTAWILMAVSFMQVQYAQEARYYALLSLFLVSALACVPTLAERRSGWAMSGFVLASAAGLYTHNITMFYLLGLFAAWLIWPGERPTKQRLIDIALAGGVLVLLYSPWVPILLQQMRWMTGTFWAKQPGAFDFGLISSAVTGVDVWYVPGAWWGVTGLQPPPHGVIAALGVACLLMAIALQSRSRLMWALAAFVLGPVVIVFVFSLIRQPIFFERLFIASSAVTPILLAMTLDRGRPLAVRSAGGAVIAVVVCLTLMSTGKLLADTRKEDWRGAYKFVAELPPSDRRLIVFVANEGELPFAYYAAQDASRQPEPRTGTPQGFFDLNPPKTIERVTSERDLTNLRIQLSSSRWEEIVLVQSHTDFADPGGLVEKEMRKHWRITGVANLRLVKVMSFSRAGMLAKTN